MASINPPMQRTASRRFSSAALRAPRLVMSWEDWLTFAAAVVTFTTTTALAPNSAAMAIAFSQSFSCW